jgi:hypothetical protein
VQGIDESQFKRSLAMATRAREHDRQVEQRYDEIEQQFARAGFDDERMPQSITLPVPGTRPPNRKGGHRQAGAIRART